MIATALLCIKMELKVYEMLFCCVKMTAEGRVKEYLDYSTMIISVEVHSAYHVISCMV